MQPIEQHPDGPFDGIWIAALKPVEEPALHQSVDIGVADLDFVDLEAALAAGPPSSRADGA